MLPMKESELRPTMRISARARPKAELPLLARDDARAIRLSRGDGRGRELSASGVFMFFVITPRSDAAE
jgi:hypothetical protein